MTRLAAVFYMDLEKQLQDVDDAGVFFVDRSRTIIHWNVAAQRLAGHDSSKVTGEKCWNDLLCHVDEAGQSLCDVSCPLRAAILDGTCREALVYLRHLDGHRQPVQVWTGPRYDEHGEIVGAVQVFTDATEPLRALGPYHEDPLTGLGNRTHLSDQLSEKLYNLARYGHPFGVLVADIDYLEQEINRAHGPGVGDQIIKMVAHTLAHSLRGSDVIVRSDGDDFVIVLQGADDAALHEIAERLRRLAATSRLSSPPHRSEVTISLGGTLAASNDQMEGLLARVQASLQEAKRAGRDRVVIQ